MANRSDMAPSGDPRSVNEASSGAVTKKVLIIVMPFATPEFPGLGATLIRSILVAAQIPTDILYGNLVFSKLVDADQFVENSLSQLPICEIAFTPYYFGTPVVDAAENLRGFVLGMASVHDAHPLERYVSIVQNAGMCLDSLFCSIPWSDYDVVGFSLLMGQTVASLALAKRIKAAHPGVTIIVGGANTQPPMGDEMLSSFPEIDYVLPGEADGTVAPFINELRRGVRTGFSTGGILYRNEEGRVCSSGDPAPFTDLDSLPVPDFTEFFAQMDGLGLTHIQPYMPIETSRGCWWGEKRHCTFCGIDDTIMVFRSKSPQRVLSEIVTLSSRHQYTEFFAVDSIINFKFFNELLPTLGGLRRKQAWDFVFFFESKSNLSRAQVRRFRYGGVNHVQPGLESFSDHVLELMNKGTTGARQIQCLKLLAEYNILADWNLIFGNPGETSEDYREICKVIPFLHHLPPLHPGGLIPMQINRYAPYHNTPEHYGIRNIRPKRYYPLIYPDKSVNLDRLAFYFECDYGEFPSDDLQLQYEELKQAVKTWRECYVRDALIQSRGPGFVQIVDRRSWVPGAPVASGEERIYVLEGIAAQIFTHCNEITSVAAVTQLFRGLCDPTEIATLLDRLVDLRLMYRSPSDQLISLPVLREAEECFWFTPDDTAGRPAAREATASAGGYTVTIGVGTSDQKALLAQQSLAAPEKGAPAILGGIRLVTGAGQPPIALQVGGRSAMELVEELAREASRTQSLSFRLVGLETDGGVDAAVLEALAQARAERLLGFQLECELKHPPTMDAAERMREAGISKVAISCTMGLSERCIVASNLQRIAAVKSLSTAGISVLWEVDPRTASLDERGCSQFLTICHAARHLPPPRIPADSDGALADALRQWSANHKPRSLTYARGPGFMRVFDRRFEDGTWRFISLRETQAQILLLCDQPRDFATLLEELPGEREDQIRSFLNALVEQNVVCRGSKDEYLGLPIRRSIEERWASGDN